MAVSKAHFLPVLSWIVILSLPAPISCTIQPLDYIVILKAGQTVHDLEDFLPASSTDLLRTYEVQGKVVALVRVTDQKLIHRLATDPRIEYIEPNQNHRLVQPVHAAQKQQSVGIRATGEHVVALSRHSSHDILSEVIVIHRIHVNRRTVALIKADTEQIEKLRTDPRVDYIEANLHLSIPTPILGTGTFPSLVVDRSKRSSHPDVCSKQYGKEESIWGLIRTSYHHLPDYTTDPYVYDNTGSLTAVYVVDTGVDITHPEFEGRATYGMVSKALDSEGHLDLNGHGTNVASLAAGKTYGIAKEAAIVACKVLDANGTGTTFGIAEGVAWVTNRVTSDHEAGKTVRAVINMSLGGTGDSKLMEEAIDGAVDQGVVVVVAAGNDAEDASSGTPSSLQSTITVAATGPQDEFASFSNYGPAVDISAAGVACLGAYSTYTQACTGQPASQCLVYMSGTSQATPHVSGVVALWLDTLQDVSASSVSPASVRAMLRGTASTGYITFSNSNQATTYNGIVYRGSSDCNGADGDGVGETNRGSVGIYRPTPITHFLVVIGAISCIFNIIMY